jgi:hypothetical protein
MTAQIFNFRNVKVRLTDTNATTVYGVTAYDSGNPNSTLPSGVLPTDVSTVVLTVQCANITGLSTLPAPANVASVVNVTVMVANSSNINTTTYLVQNYPVIPANAFDPLSGNLVLTAGDQLQVQGNFANGIDVIVTLLEIANASAS